MGNHKNIIILSEKSSGSSACQNLLTKLGKVQHVSKTRHYQNETLYWTKAASILDLPQVKMVDSEVPIEPEKAKTALILLLKENLDHYVPAKDDKELINGRLGDSYVRSIRRYFLKNLPIIYASGRRSN